MQNNELQHVGVKGMRWGHRTPRPTAPTSDLKKHYDAAKDQKKATNETSKTTDKKFSIKNPSKTLKIGASVGVGLLATNFGGLAVYNLTGSASAASIAAPSLGIIGGMKYYEWINS